MPGSVFTTLPKLQVNFFTLKNEHLWNLNNLFICFLAIPHVHFTVILYAWPSKPTVNQSINQIKPSINQSIHQSMTVQGWAPWSSVCAGLCIVCVYPLLYSSHTPPRKRFFYFFKPPCCTTRWRESFFSSSKFLR